MIDTSSYILAQKAFVMWLGLSYFLAYWSLFKQVLGLYGSHGIIPLHETLTAVQQRNYLQTPTLFWFDSSDRALKGLAGLGCLLSIPVMLNIWPAFFLFLLWMGYLSYVSVGFVFLSFQWDILLLEVGFVGMFFAIQSPPPIFLLIALWVLLFRLMVSSGLVKYLSACPEWRSCQAMDYHYETQPIPNMLAYFAHQQPKWLSKATTVVTFALEVAVPVLIFGTDQTRLIAFILLVFLQIMIMLTGNYAFFNVLTIALCFPLLASRYLEWLFGPAPAAVEPNLYVQVPLEILGIGLIFLNALEFSRLFVGSRWVNRILRKIAPYHIINAYGLFARMTTHRDEIIVEGSMDGKEWKIYEFKWKPGNVFVNPRQVAPYHPRLDWQMWFAALGNYQSNQWFVNFLLRLLDGSKDVTELLRVNPFSETPPKFIRARLYEYHFSDLKTKRETGQWWTRKLKGFYTPTYSRK